MTFAVLVVSSLQKVLNCEVFALTADKSGESSEEDDVIDRCSAGKGLVRQTRTQWDAADGQRHGVDSTDKH